MKMFMLTLMISISIMMMNNKIMKKKKKMNFNSSYECGFMNMKKKRSPMSIQFYMISMIFLMFDLEMMIIIPMMMSMKNSPMKTNKTALSFIMMMMFITIMYEWLNNSIKWKM